jgi:hypothetical protein
MQGVRMSRNRILIGSIIIAGLAALGATWMSTLLWGYQFTPPSMDPLLHPMYPFEGIGHFSLTLENGRYVAHNTSVNYDAYWFEDVFTRPEREMIKHGLSGITPLNDVTLTFVAQVLQNQDWSLFHPLSHSDASQLNKPYYLRALPSGYVIQGYLDGKPIYFISVSGVNGTYKGRGDTYGYYEGRFIVDSLTPAKWQTFAYGISGIEFLQWPTLFVYNLLPLLIGLILIVLLRGPLQLLYIRRKITFVTG